MTHCPLPWVVLTTHEMRTSMIATRDGEVVQLVATVQGERRDANAEFIVRAVNSHDELVAALKELREELRDTGWWTAKNFGWPDRSARLDAVIAKAEAQ